MQKIRRVLRRVLLRDLGFLLACTTVWAHPVHLRTEHLSNPLGIDADQPRFSWQSDDKGRNWIQSAWQISVASSLEGLRNSKPDIWDSGRQNGGESTGIAYKGPALQTGRRYYWAVRAWDGKGHSSQSEEAAWWEMGLLKPADWKAQWIGWSNPDEPADESAIHWIWVAGQDALHVQPGTEASFHLDFSLAQNPESAAFFLMARGDWALTVNGVAVASKRAWNQFDRQEIRTLLHPGANAIDVKVSLPRQAGFGETAGPRPGALAALLKVTHADRAIERIPTDARWKGSAAGTAGAAPAIVVGPYNDPELGSVPGQLPQPAALLRKSFMVDKPVARARAYVTSLGVYELSLNGQRLGQGVLTPGFTDFSKRVQYQTFDLTGLLTPGENVAAAMLGAGWFASGLSWTAQHFVPDPETRFIAQFEIDFKDGTHQTLCTDPTWKGHVSPILHSEIYAGETYDARLEQSGWQKPGFHETAWEQAVAGSGFKGVLSSQVDALPQVIATMKPEKIHPLPDNTYVFDMGQNMVGWTALKVNGPAGTVVRLRFAEILNPDGSIYRTNLRNADATDTYTLRGGGEEVFRPRFTFHGFRYVELKGFPGTPTLESITGEVVSSLAGDPTAKVTTSSDLVNHMWGLGIWGQRGNFLSVPTDCPQRDERLGWMADAAVFWRTGSYNFDISAFTNKWLRDVDDAQSAAGAFSNVAPSIGVGTIEGAPGWGDAGVIVPWTTWIQYGDPSVIERNWESMERWMKFIADNNPDYLRRNKVGPNFADWLAPDTTTPTDLTNTAYWALITDMMTQMAHAVGKDDASQRYAQMHESIRSAFQKAFVHPNGEVGSGSQTGYVLALHMKLLPPEMEATAVNNLVKNIERYNWHLTTGFLGTPFLLFSLADHGRSDVAYRLLLNDTYPSWGYMLSKGATTWWERWNGDTGDPAMNSYNHYAFGSVVAWIYQCVAGIDTASSNPGFHQIIIHPRVSADITHAHGEYESPYGPVVTDWNGTPTGPFTLKVTLPANTTAQVILPDIPNTHLTESGKSLKASREAGPSSLTVGSGSYEFRLK